MFFLFHVMRVWCQAGFFAAHLSWLWNDRSWKWAAVGVSLTPLGAAERVSISGQASLLTGPAQKSACVTCWGHTAAPWGSAAEVDHILWTGNPHWLLRQGSWCANSSFHSFHFIEVLWQTCSSGEIESVTCEPVPLLLISHSTFQARLRSSCWMQITALSSFVLLLNDTADCNVYFSRFAVTFLIIHLFWPQL